MPTIEEKLSHLTREELIHHLVSVELGRFINFYKNLPDIHTAIVAEARPSPYKNKLFEQRPYSAENMARVRINIGKRNGFSVPKLFEVVNSQKNIKGIQIGDIRLEGEHTLLEIDKGRMTMFMNALNGKNINGVSLRVEPAGDNAPPVRSASERTHTPVREVAPIYMPSAPAPKIFTERVRGKKPGKKKY
jgi:ATP-dependent RNA helicase DeaD